MKGVEIFWSSSSECSKRSRNFWSLSSKCSERRGNFRSLSLECSETSRNLSPECSESSRNFKSFSSEFSERSRNFRFSSLECCERSRNFKSSSSECSERIRNFPSFSLECSKMIRNSWFWSEGSELKLSAYYVYISLMGKKIFDLECRDQKPLILGLRRKAFFCQYRKRTELLKPGTIISTHSYLNRHVGRGHTVLVVFPS